MMIEWYKTGMSGAKPAMPAPGYTWRQLPELNRKIRDDYSGTDLSTVRKMFDKSFLDVQAIIAAHTSDELFEKKRYNWTGTTSLAAYLIANTSSHYNWAIKLIKKAKNK